MSRQQVVNSQQLESVQILGVRVDRVTLDQATDLVFTWTKQGKKRVVVTPNIEFIIAAQTDSQFKKLLNQADLNIPDSSRIGWIQAQLSHQPGIKRWLHWLSFPFSSRSQFPVTTGADLMEHLCQKSAELGISVGFLGGKVGVAIKAAQVLKQKYPDLKVVLADSGPAVDSDGELMSDFRFPTSELGILFVGFGQRKQEKWIFKNKDQIKARVFIGVGGAFDYLSGRVRRAPVWIRKLGLEWLFRLVIQPWRIKRQLEIAKFILQIL